MVIVSGVQLSENPQSVALNTFILWADRSVPVIDPPSNHLRSDRVAPINHQ